MRQHWGDLPAALAKALHKSPNITYTPEHLSTERVASTLSPRDRIGQLAMRSIDIADTRALAKHAELVTCIRWRQLDVELGRCLGIERQSAPALQEFICFRPDPV